MSEKVLCTYNERRRKWWKEAKNKVIEVWCLCVNENELS